MEQHSSTMPRRSSTASAYSTASSHVSSVVGNGHMTEEEQEQCRRRIQEVMKDSSLSAVEKSRQIQSFMDGRRGRRSSACSNVSGLISVGSQTSASRAPSTYGGTVLSHGFPTNATAARSSGSVASSYNSDDDDNDAVMSEAPFNIATSRGDDRSIASSVTSDHDDSTASSAQRMPPHSSYKQLHGRSHSLQDWNDQERVTAASGVTVLDAAKLMEQSRPVCQHYERNCTLIAPCCGTAFGCRICHDECPTLPPPLAARRSSFTHHPYVPSKNVRERRRSMSEFVEHADNDGGEQHHVIDRFAVAEVICRECYTRQSSKTDNCIKCGVSFGEYHCHTCNLWMSNHEAPYHCDDCGFCRVGGRENFTHCHDCGMCIDALLFDNHNCKSGKYMSNCPICQEDLFSSRFASHELPCGHAIHWHCFQELTSYDTRCPVCKKTAESPDQMAATWSAIAMGIALQPVPSEMARVVNITCNDCEKGESNRRWHFLGVRCMHCLSFNTNVEQIVLQGRNAADFLDQQRSEVPANISMPVLHHDNHNQHYQESSDTVMEDEPGESRLVSIDDSTSTAPGATSGLGHI